MVKEHEAPGNGSVAEHVPRGERGREREEARVADAERQQSRPGRRLPAYEKWTREALYAHARSRRIPGRSSMSKQQLINALRKS
ncbi:MAG: hypothetical protein U1E38_06640 [Rhodospirillales bacterium]